MLLAEQTLLLWWVRSTDSGQFWETLQRHESAGGPRIIREKPLWVSHTLSVFECFDIHPANLALPKFA